MYVESEQTRIVIRNARQKGNEDIKKLHKDGLSEDLARDGEAQIQQLTNRFVKKVEELQKNKEEEIMTI